MNRSTAILARLTAAILSGGLIALASSLHPLWWAAWIAPVPVLVAAFNSRFWSGFATAFLAGALGSFPLFLYIQVVAPLPVAASIVVELGIVLAVCVALAAAARNRLPAALAVFAFPALYTGLETLSAATSPHGTAGSLAYSQMAFTSALQVASVGGSAAVTFLVTLFNSALAFFAADRGKTKRATVAANVGGVVVAALVLGFGSLRLVEAPKAPTMTVALAGIDQKSDLPRDWRATLATYQSRLDEARAKGAKLIVLPEEIALLPQADQPAMEAQLAPWAKGAQATLEVGFRVAPPAGRARNRLFLFTPEGTVITYDKRHLIPGLESSQVDPSTNPALVVKVDDRIFGGAICKDWDFSEIGQHLSLGHAAIVVAPGWDFGRDGWLHGRMAMLRAVEGGFTLVRSARGGIMSVSDRYGRVLAEAPSGPDAPLLVAQAPIPNAEPTLYARIGNVFGWACLALAALVLGGVFIRRPTAT
jgi:apolipoprotein N-acyltransferase